jgi:hypothetical protein
VFIDETGASTNARSHGRCRRGRRLRAAVPHGHYKTVTLVAGLRLRGLAAQKAFDRPINAAWTFLFLKNTFRLFSMLSKSFDLHTPSPRNCCRLQVNPTERANHLLPPSNATPPDPAIARATASEVCSNSESSGR